MNLVSIGEALTHSKYTHEHIAFLLRSGKVQGRKSASVWLVDLDSLLEYEKEMDKLGPQKHDPKKE